MSQRNEKNQVDPAPTDWSEIFTSPRPTRIGTELRSAILCHAQQEKQFRAEFRRIDRQLQTVLAASQAPDAHVRVGGVGTRLVRSWRGVRHEVMVLEKGFAYRSKSYRSLSEIARLVTGVRRSGPRFFGVQESP